MLEKLKEKVLKANLDLVKYGLVLFTWGNVSERDKETGYVVIKPSGVSYDSMTANDMVVVDLDGNVIEGKLNPSSDTPTHLELYKEYNSVCGITHTHSTYATAFAQAKKNIKFLGTTHADYFYGDILCTRPLSEDEVMTEYEKNTGSVIIETYKDCDPLSTPAILVASHGTFSFGKDSFEAVHNAVVCEEVAKMASITESINASISQADKYLMDKHYNRKHGKGAYYGQKKP